jgi:hypothetical protein
MPRITDPSLLSQLETSQSSINKAAPAPTAVDPAALMAVRQEALDKIKMARSLQDRSKNQWFATGFGSGMARLIGGTPAYDLARDTDTLSNAGALTKVMEMARNNGGKNPLSPLSEGDFKAIASSVSNLDPSQSDTQYQANVQRVADLYARAYQGAGGQDLEGDLNPAMRKRRVMPGAPVAPRRAAPKVVNFSDLKD